MFAHGTCDIQAPFCSVPQRMGKTWATAGHRDTTGGLPTPAPVLGLCHSHIPREEHTAPHPFLWSQGNLFDGICSSREQERFTQGFFVGMISWASGPTDVFCSFPLQAAATSPSPQRSWRGLRSLEAAGEIHHETGLLQGTTAPHQGLAPAQAGDGGTDQSRVLRHDGAWGASLLSCASYCQQLNKLIGRIFPWRGRRLLI